MKCYLCKMTNDNYPIDFTYMSKQEMKHHFNTEIEAYLCPYCNESLIPGISMHILFNTLENRIIDKLTKIIKEKQNENQ